MTERKEKRGPVYFPGTTRVLTQSLLKQYRAECRSFPPTMTPQEHPDRVGSCGCVGAWRSKHFSAIAYREPNGYLRISINRVEVNTKTGDWKDGITWDELQKVKEECGFGDRWAVEVYPPEEHVVNVANLRHLMILNEKPAYAWGNLTDGGA